MSEKALEVKDTVKNMKGNMTEGKPAKVMLLFVIPMIIGNIFQQFYTLVDSMLVGNMIDEKALAAVGASSAITMLFVMFAAGAGIGCSVIISQLFGAKQIEKMKTAISTAIVTVLGVAIIFSIIGRLLSHQILIWMQTPKAVLESATVYLNIYFYGFVFLFLYNMFNAIFNALGASKIPLIFLIFSSLLNVGLDIVMIEKMGIAGAAWATLIAQAASAVLSFIVLVFKIRRMESGAHEFYNWGLMKTMAKVAIPSIIQQSIVSIGMLLVQVAANTQGAEFMAGYTAAGRIDGIAIVPLVNVGNAVSTFVAQNMGAKKLERAKEGYKIGLIIGISIGVAIAILLFFCAEPFVAAFMDSKEAATSIQYGVDYLSVLAFFYMVFAIMNASGAVLRGAGDMKWFMAQTFSNLAVRVILTYAFIGLFGGNVIAYATAASWLVASIISFIRYKSGKWMEKKLI